MNEKSFTAVPADEPDGIADNEAISAQSVLNREKTRKIIEQGIAAEKAIFADGALGKFAAHIPPEKGYYDVVLHGTPETVMFFGTKTDSRTLAEIIKNRKDYHGEAVRLLSCCTGDEQYGEKCFAARLAKALGVEVKAPDKTLWVFPPDKNGVSGFSTGTTAVSNDGKFIVYKP